jgi:hypothetical protein
MATRIDWKDLYSMAKKNVGPKWRDLRDRDSDDWLTSVGLEKRNVAADIFGAIGLIAVGCGLGVALGMLFAPKKGDELRKEMTEKLRGQASKLSGEARNQPSGYSS